MAELLFPLQYKRQYAAPLDIDLVFATITELNSYLSNARRYPGQIVSCLQTEGLIYVLNNNANGWLVHTSGSSGHTIALNNISYTNRTKLNFSSSLINIIDNPTNDSTDISIFPNVLNSASLNDVIKYNGSEWINGQLSGGHTIKLNDTSFPFRDNLKFTSSFINIDNDSTNTIINIFPSVSNNSIQNDVILFDGNNWINSQYLKGHTISLLNNDYTFRNKLNFSSSLFSINDNSINNSTDINVFPDINNPQQGQIIFYSSSKWINSNFKEGHNISYNNSVFNYRNTLNFSSSIISVEDDGNKINVYAFPNILNPINNDFIKYSSSQWINTQISKTDIGLSNVTNDTQVKKISSSTDKSIATWNGNTGDLLQSSLPTIDATGSLNLPSRSFYKINNINLSKSDIGLSNVTNNEQVKLSDVETVLSGTIGKIPDSNAVLNAINLYVYHPSIHFTAVTGSFTYNLRNNAENIIQGNLLSGSIATLALATPTSSLVNETVLHFSTSGSVAPTFIYSGFTPVWLNNLPMNITINKKYTIVFEQIEQTSGSWIVKTTGGSY